MFMQRFSKKPVILVGFWILFSYLILFTRAWKISRDNEGAFAKLLAIGIGFWFSCQGLVHIAVKYGVIPATGQTLPFISRVVLRCLPQEFMIGVLLNISKNRKSNPKKQLS
jgi:cell division protein FtsW